jgi:hypothetical protein
LERSDKSGIHVAALVAVSAALSTTPSFAMPRYDGVKFKTG